MQVLVIGGTGFIGRALAAELAKAGHAAMVSSRSPDRARAILGGTARVRAWDGTSAPDLARILEAMGPEPFGVVNLAGENIAAGPWTRERKERILQSRVQAARALAEAAALSGNAPAVAVAASAAGYYGSLAPGDDQAWFDESSPPGQGFLADVCRAWEAASEPLEALGTRRAIIRTGMVLGRGGGALVAMARPFRWFLGGPLGGRQWVSWIHLSDQAGAIRFLLEARDAAGPYNLTAPEPVRMARFCALLGRAMGRPSWLAVPPAVLRLALGEMAREMILSSQRVRPRRLAEAGYVHRLPLLEQALAESMGQNAPGRRKEHV